MSARTPRLWDVVTESDLRLFFPGVAAAPARQPPPLPGRAVRFARPASAPPLADALPPGVALFTSADEYLLVGPAHRLRETAHRWGCAAGSDLVLALDRYESPVRTLRFADDEVWDLSGRTRIMGIVNVTPDSFSDGGRHLDPAKAIEHGLALAEAGADILDVGGESTRPGADPVLPEDERDRVVSVLAGLRASLPRARLSIDTRRAEVARAALDAGADLVNDVSALGDPGMAALVAGARCPLILMHMRGEPRSMQSDTHYDDLWGEIVDLLAERVDVARNHGVAGDRILADPGIGFGKSAIGNEVLLRSLRVLRSLGLPVVVGASRKSFLGARTGVENPAERLLGSVAAAVLAVRGGDAAMVRVHDVAATREALAVTDAVRTAGDSA